MSNTSVKSILEKAFENYLKELNKIKLEIVRESFPMRENLNEKKDGRTRKSKSE
ncbi:MAG TPA: hypothetical protein VGO21_02450 [Candidatus Paceibacterota bacterium]|jgi:hypothetical protein|nr:hypothetical protein [Candidatus Paceibacterota bacterium]